MTAYLTAGLGFGDEGKGAIVDALVRQMKSTLVIRYNGGAQCEHNVVAPDGRHHPFKQLGSGSFVPEVMTYLSRFVLINPPSMLVEAENLSRVGVHNILSRVMVDGKAVVITPFQKSLNRLQEMSRKGDRHGSTGMGIGVTRSDYLEHGDAMLLAEDLFSSNTSRSKDKLEFTRQLCRDRAFQLSVDINEPSVRDEFDVLNGTRVIPWCLEQYRTWCQEVSVVEGPPPVQHQNVVFEGAQGMLLDEKWGFHPHTTWSDITFTNAETILKEMNYKGGTYKIGVLRSYATRHGAGPFPSEDPTLDYTEMHNKAGDYAGSFRLGHFDVQLTEYAIRCIKGVDSLAVNHMDVVADNPSIKMRVASDGLMETAFEDFLPIVENLLETPVSIIGYGPTTDEKVFVEAIWSPKEIACQN